MKDKLIDLGDGTYFLASLVERVSNSSSHKGGTIKVCLNNTRTLEIAYYSASAAQTEKNRVVHEVNECYGKEAQDGG
jgi:hypothetical protein